MTSLVFGLGFAPIGSAETRISGIDGEALDNVQTILSLNQENCESPAWKIEQLFEQSASEIDRALRVFGYYHSTAQKSLVFDNDCWRAQFDITSGVQTTVSDIAIVIVGDGKNDSEFRTPLDKFSFKKGDPMHHGRYEKLKKRISSLALERGYIKGEFIEKTLRIHTDRHAASIRLVFNTGIRFRFGAITVHQDVLDAYFARSFIKIDDNEYYSSGRLAKIYNDLSSSGYFELIEVRPNIEQEQNGKVPVEITLVAKKKHGFRFGVGFDTDIGPLFSASHTNRRINPIGHSLTSNLKLSPVLSSIDTEYSIPMDKPVSDRLSLGVGYQVLDSDTVESQTATASVQLLKVFESGWRRTYFLDLSHEIFSTDGEDNEATLLVPGGNWRRSVSNNLLRPTQGYSVFFELKGSYENPLSDVSFVQAESLNAWIQNAPWGGKFIARIDLGATLVSEFEKLPTSYRFFAGGTNSIRGYDFQELGPVDDEGDVIGGRFLTIVSAEYEHTVLENWGLAVFVDHGNAFNENRISLKTGVGVGLRWYSPIGPVRIDMAFPLNEAESSIRFHFAAGARL